MANAFRLACVQVNAGNEIAPNLEMASKLTRQAADEGVARTRQGSADAKVGDGGGSSGLEGIYRTRRRIG